MHHFFGPFYAHVCPISLLLSSPPASLPPMLIMSLKLVLTARTKWVCVHSYWYLSAWKWFAFTKHLEDQASTSRASAHWIASAGGRPASNRGMDLRRSLQRTPTTLQYRRDSMVPGPVCARSNKLQGWGKNVALLSNNYWSRRRQYMLSKVHEVRIHQDILELNEKLNSVALVREWTISTERLPLVDEVSVNFCGKWVSCGQRNVSLRPYSRLSRPNSTHKPEWTPFQTHYYSENPVVPEIEPGPLDL
jgi:hypothetical protein